MPPPPRSASATCARPKIGSEFLATAPSYAFDVDIDRWVARYLGEATIRFNRRLDAASIAEQLVHAFVPRLSTAALLHLRRPDGVLAPVAIAHAEPDIDRQLVAVATELEIEPVAARALLRSLVGAGRRTLPCSGLVRLFSDASDQAESLLRWGVSGNCVLLPIWGDGEPVGLLTTMGGATACDWLVQLRAMLAAEASHALQHADSMTQHAQITALADRSLVSHEEGRPQ